MSADKFSSSRLLGTLPNGKSRFAHLSKAKFAAIAYDLAALCNDSGSCDDHESTLRKIDECAKLVSGAR